ncbi:tetratricopeptide repeat-containing sensor histidine kinase [Epilithonimonas hungarica]|uniref:histidine kinase n=1 Tax=Epilithonimonas hungarica TaxID=454006 RepID=A0A1G7G569_9FLAO|nr:tetratricopeptide repeat-containing sensor histidine kinase [Epilithonimonas hungarica]SDE83225.1 Histidine kinase-, DNA gyrase B-, and HSP90-like ATPase [Epilithonimonas hungarica]
MKFLYFLLGLSFLIGCSEHSIKEIEKTTDNAFYDKAFDFREKNELDSSFLYFFRAKDSFLQKKDSFGVGKCLANLAIIQETKGDYFGSQESGLSALDYFNQRDSIEYNYISINYNTLSIVSSRLKDYKKAIEFYLQAIKFSNDSINKNIYRNNLANSYRKEKKYNSASKIFQSILDNNTKKDKEYSRALSNFAYSKWLQNSNFNPIPEFKQALNIRIKEKDLWGQNASYAHFADYYSRKKSDSALFYAKKMFDVSNKIKSPDDQIEALQKLIVLDSKNYSSHFNRYQFLNDSLQTARNKAKNQFALIRYETEKSKADNLKLQKDNTEKKYQIIRQKGLTVGVSTLAIISSIIGIFWYRRRKQRMEQEKLLEVKNTELKYSKKIHDVVANGLYHTMIEIQNQPELDKEKILNRIEKMYEESRDIAQDEIIEKDFYSRFYKMMNSYSSNDQRILPVGYKDNIWENLSDNAQSELYYIIREILVNMKKHSKAKLASLKFEKSQDNLTIRYTDNGIGISNLESKKGTGLRNTENRIDSINGDIIFEQNPRGGLIIQITVPIHSKYV